LFVRAHLVPIYTTAILFCTAQFWTHWFGFCAVGSFYSLHSLHDVPTPVPAVTTFTLVLTDRCYTIWFHTAIYHGYTHHCVSYLPTHPILVTTFSPVTVLCRDAKLLRFTVTVPFVPDTDIYYTIPQPLRYTVLTTAFTFRILPIYAF